MPQHKLKRRTFDKGRAGILIHSLAHLYLSEYYMDSRLLHGPTNHPFWFIALWQSGDQVLWSQLDKFCRVFPGRTHYALFLFLILILPITYSNPPASGSWQKHLSHFSASKSSQIHQAFSSSWPNSRSNLSITHYQQKHNDIHGKSILQVKKSWSWKRKTYMGIPNNSLELHPGRVYA